VTEKIRENAHGNRLVLHERLARDDIHPVGDLGVVISLDWQFR